jgi:16S rRNA G966 N2-methylase RsmD
LKIEELALQRNKYRHLSDEEWKWFLQQVEGRERTADKLPAFAQIADWWYPARLSCEQCSSELTARYKAEIIDKSQELRAKSQSTMVDLTGGYGVDTYFLSAAFEHTDYVEQNAELCRIAEHNFKVQSDKVQGTKISVHNTTAEDFLKRAGQYDLIYLDPARRDSHGGKVFRLEDCTPNVVELLPTLVEHLTENGRLMIKLSPMLDITQAMRKVQSDNVQGTKVNWDIHVVAVKNEVKEVLLIGTKGQSTKYNGTITAIDLAKKDQAFVFTQEEEQEAQSAIGHLSLEIGNFIFEPNAAILKAGAYKLVGERFGLQKLDVNTHLYCSEEYVENFPGRVWKIKEASFPLSPKGARDKQANVLVRNYPLTAEQLKKKLHLRDGGTAFVIGCRVNGKPTVYLVVKYPG